MSIFDRSYNSLINFTPVLLMSGLALFSFVLVKQSPQASSKAHLQQAANTDHDYYLQSFVASRYGSSGNVDSYIRGDRAEHYERTEELAISNIDFYLNKTHNLYQGVAKKGLVNDSANSIQLYEQVNIHRSNAGEKGKDAQFESQFLKLTTSPDSLSSDKPVKISDGRSVISANSLQYDSTIKMLKMNGSVNIKINPNK